MFKIFKIFKYLNIQVHTCGAPVPREASGGGAGVELTLPDIKEFITAGSKVGILAPLKWTRNMKGTDIL